MSILGTAVRYWPAFSWLSLFSLSLIESCLLIITMWLIVSKGRRISFWLTTAFRINLAKVWIEPTVIFYYVINFKNLSFSLDFFTNLFYWTIDNLCLSYFFLNSCSSKNIFSERPPYNLFYGNNRFMMSLCASYIDIPCNMN